MLALLRLLWLTISGLLRLGWVLAGVSLATTLAVLLWALDTPVGLRFAASHMDQWTGGAMVIGSASGRLLHDFELRDVVITDREGLRITVDRARLAMKPRELLLRRLHVTRLEIGTLDILAPPTPSSPDPITMPVQLPVDLVVDQAELAKLIVRTAAPPAESVFELSDAAGRASWRGPRMTVDELRVTIPWTGPLRGHAVADSGGAWIDAQEVVVDGPGHLEAKGRYGFDVIASDVQLTSKGLRWPFVETRGEPPLVDGLDGKLHWWGHLEDWQATLATTATLQRYPARLSANARGNLDAVTVEKLLLDALDEQGKPHGELRAEGSVAWSPALRAELEVGLSHIDPLLFGAGVAGDLNGQISSTTTMAGDEPRVQFKAAIAPATLAGKPLSLEAHGELDSRRVELARLLLLAGGGRVEANGRVAWSPQLAPDLEARFSRLDPAQFLPGWAGDLNGRIALKPAPEGAIDLLASLVGSRLRGQPVSAEAKARYGADRLSVDTFKLASGSTRLSASGEALPPFALEGQISSPDLASLLPDLAGRLSGSFRLDGTLERPHLVTEGSAEQLAWQTLKLARLDWHGDLDPQADSVLDVHAAGLVANEQRVRQATLSLRGQEVWHQAQLDVDAEAGRVRSALAGGYDRVRGEWGGELSSLAIEPAGLAAWSLQKGAGILAGARRRALEPACLSGDGGTACFDLEQNVLSDGTRLGWKLQRLLLATFNPLLRGGLELGGNAEGEGHINFTGGDIAEAEARLDLHEMSVDAPDTPPLKLSEAKLRADQRDGVLHATARVAAGDATVDADVRAAPGDNFMTRALSGRVDAQIPSLAFVNALVPALARLDGSLRGGYAIGGTPRAPRLTGELKLAEARARLVVAGIELKDGQLVLRSDGGETMTLDGGIASGEGRLALSGQLEPFATPLRAQLAVTGDRFQAMNTPQARAWITPDLKLVRDAAGLDLKGSLSVPRADITPKGLGGGGVSVSDDQVLVGVEAPEAEAPLPITIELALRLGDAVRIEGFGLKTRIEGGVELSQLPRREARGRGELRLVDGSYKAYGQDLKIETGRLLFTGGDVKTPGLDLYATRHPRDDLTVGVRVRGTLAKPELSLQSSPTMPREQQLSWLVLGRSLETSSTQDRSLMQSAALSLGLGGSDFVANLIGKRIGIDEVSIGSAAAGGSEVAPSSQTISGAQTGATATAAATAANAAQLTLGKYLTPRLFVSYGVSLFQQGYSVRLLYTLGNGFKLATESGTESGGDLIYQTDRGKRPKPPAITAPAKPAQ